MTDSEEKRAKARELKREQNRRYRAANPEKVISMRKVHNAKWRAKRDPWVESTYQHEWRKQNGARQDAKAKAKRKRIPCDLNVPPHLYVMRRSDAPHIFKIGRSRDPALRAKQLGESHCFKVECLMSFDQAGVHELEVHKRLDEYRVVGGQGREWFEAPLELITKTVHEVMAIYE